LTEQESWYSMDARGGDSWIAGPEAELAAMRDEAGDGLIRTLDQRRSTLNKSEGCLRTFGCCCLVSGGGVVVVSKKGTRGDAA